MNVLMLAMAIWAIFATKEVTFDCPKGFVCEQEASRTALLDLSTYTTLQTCTNAMKNKQQLISRYGYPVFDDGSDAFHVTTYKLACKELVTRKGK